MFYAIFHFTTFTLFMQITRQMLFEFNEKNYANAIVNAQALISLKFAPVSRQRTVMIMTVAAAAQGAMLSRWKS